MESKGIGESKSGNGLIWLIGCTILDYDIEGWDWWKDERYSIMEIEKRDLSRRCGLAKFTGFM